MVLSTFREIFRFSAMLRGSLWWLYRRFVKYFALLRCYAALFVGFIDVSWNISLFWNVTRLSLMVSSTFREILRSSAMLRCSLWWFYRRFVKYFALLKCYAALLDCFIDVSWNILLFCDVTRFSLWFYRRFVKYFAFLKCYAALLMVSSTFHEIFRSSAMLRGSLWWFYRRFVKYFALLRCYAALLWWFYRRFVKYFALLRCYAALVNGFIDVSWNISVPSSRFV